MKKTVLVTGAGGFSGKYLCAYLIRQGYGVAGTRVAGDPVRAPYPLHGLDISKEPAVHRLIRSLRPSSICHLAAQSSPKLSWKNPQESFRVNAAGTFYLLNAVRKYAPRARVLYISSSQVYGRTFQSQKKVREKNLLHPQSPYAASKALGELACLNFAGQFNLDMIRVRPTNHLGAGQAPDFVFSDWCRQIARAEKGFQKPVLRVGNLEVLRDFLHVQDVVRAYEILIRKGKPGHAYNLSSGRAEPLRKFLEFLLKKSKISIRVLEDRERLRRHEIRHACLDAGKLKSLGWRPQRTVFEALEELLNDWRARN